ncbi:MAG: PKD domain-containing protein, partial [Acidimicrobiia bacterium]|nr:PKD domain-containing protein [Acidimicrobiia bacterium]
RLVPGTAFDNFRLTDQQASALGLKGMDGSGAVLNHRTGSAYDPDGHMWYFWGGGGTSYGGNEVYRIDLDTLQIEWITAPSLLDDFIVDADGVTCPVPSVGPSAASTFDGIIWSPSTQTFFVYPTGYFCMDGTPSQNSVWEFDPNSLTWVPITETPDFDGYVLAEHDPGTDSIIVVSGDSVRELDPITGQHSAPVNLGQSLGQGSAVLDSDRLQLLLVNQQGIHSAPLDDLGNVAPLAPLPEGGDPHMGAVYVPHRSLLVMWSGNKEVRTFDPDTLEWALYTASDGPTMQGAGVFSKWIYIEELDVFAGYNNIDEGIWLYSLPGDAFGGGGTIANTAPVADAGSDQAVPAGDMVGLDGSASFDPDGDPLSHNWTLVSRPAGSSAVLSNPQAIQPSFVADAVGNYTVQLTVDDGVLNSQDAVVVSSVNGAPVADAGPDQSVTVGDSVTLDGSGSHDPNGDPLTYAWSVLSAPTGSTATLQNPGSENAMLVPDIAGLFVVGLFVHDGFEQSVADSVTIEASLATIITNQAPTDLLLSNNTVPSDATNGTLVGKVTVTDPDAGDTATTTLTNDAGGRFAIGAANGQITVAKATLLQPGTSYSITVQASDSGGLTYSESFTIEVAGSNTYYFFDGFETYSAESKRGNYNNEDIFVSQGGPWYQYIGKSGSYVPEHNVFEVTTKRAFSGNQSFHFRVFQEDLDARLALDGKPGIKNSLLKDDRVTFDIFQFGDGEVVSV